MASLKTQMLSAPSLLALDLAMLGTNLLNAPRLVPRSHAYPFQRHSLPYVVLAPPQVKTTRPRRVSFQSKADADKFIRYAKHYGWDTAYEGAFRV